MLHLWLRAESKPFERRVALAPAAAQALVAAGFTVSVEECIKRVFDFEAGIEAAHAGEPIRLQSSTVDQVADMHLALGSFEDNFITPLFNTCHPARRLNGASCLHDETPVIKRML